MSGILLVLVLLLATPGVPLSHAWTMFDRQMMSPFGLKLGMTEEAVEEILRSVAKEQKEEGEGERIRRQEVWILNQHRQVHYVITRYNRERQLALLTVVAHPKRLRYTDIRPLREATFVTDGINYAYTWKIPAITGERATYLKARGGNRKYLTSYVISYSR